MHTDSVIFGEQPDGLKMFFVLKLTLPLMMFIINHISYVMKYSFPKNNDKVQFRHQI